MSQTTTISWDSKFEVGHQRIDFEHRIFLDLINSYRDKLETHAKNDALIRILNEIAKYAAFHFVSEENIMEECGYPEQARHARLHQALLAELDCKVKEMHTTPIPGIESVKFYAFLVDWFVNHTIQEDKKLADYISRKFGAAASGTPS